MSSLVEKSHHTQSFARYLPREAPAFDWGIEVIDAGFARIGKGSVYPPSNHPNGYLFTWEKGRILAEYQLVYIAEGEGVVETSSGGAGKLKAGDVLLIFPGEWHRYRPSLNTGWVEYWVGFCGTVASSYLEEHFERSSPIINLQNEQALQVHFDYIIRLFQSPGKNFSNQISTLCLHLLTELHNQLETDNGKAEWYVPIHLAQQYLLEHYDETVDLEELAKRFGLSYTRFRSRFREVTGFSPHHYQLRIRINRAKDLLRNEQRSVSEIADELGFASVYYFSRLFKSYTGLAPSKWRITQADKNYVRER